MCLTRITCREEEASRSMSLFVCARTSSGSSKAGALCHLRLPTRWPGEKTQHLQDQPAPFSTTAADLRGPRHVGDSLALRRPNALEGTTVPFSCAWQADFCSKPQVMHKHVHRALCFMVHPTRLPPANSGTWTSPTTVASARRASESRVRGCARKKLNTSKRFNAKTLQKQQGRLVL